MYPASYQSSSDRRRATGLGLALIAHILVVIVLVKLAPEAPPPPEKPHRPNAFRLLPEPKPAPPTPVVAKAKRPTGGAPPPRPTPPAEAHSPKPPQPEMPFLIGGKEMFEAADLSKLPRHPGSGDGQSSGKDSKGTYGPGEGPGGETLYNAEWYREPTSAEINGYLPASAHQTGWGLIACKTIPDYRVENCRVLGESPPGSGLARAMRQAAWQFRVRPPRINGRPVIGAWVRIRYDLTITTEKPSNRRPIPGGPPDDSPGEAPGE